MSVPFIATAIPAVDKDPRVRKANGGTGSFHLSGFHVSVPKLTGRETIVGIGRVIEGRFRIDRAIGVVVPMNSAQPIISTITLQSK
jgi:hypothetical protein